MECIDIFINGTAWSSFLFPDILCLHFIPAAPSPATLWVIPSLRASLFANFELWKSQAKAFYSCTSLTIIFFWNDCLELSTPKLCHPFFDLIFLLIPCGNCNFTDTLVPVPHLIEEVTYHCKFSALEMYKHSKNMFQLVEAI